MQRQLFDPADVQLPESFAEKASYRETQALLNELQSWQNPPASTKAKSRHLVTRAGGHGTNETFDFGSTCVPPSS